jgi:acyl-CoA reductase-like NAD-dependent aldehyde dehydrogenase
VEEAGAAGATVLTGGRRDGTTYAPTVLTGVPRDARIDDSPFGLQAGVSTARTATAFRAHRDLAVGREGQRAAMEELTEERVLVLTGSAL